MQEYILAVDDTAFATKEKHFETLKSEETCFVSVAIRSNVLPILQCYMQEKTDKLFEKFCTREFHFTDIYNRKGYFKSIEIEETLDIVRSFADDMNDAGMIITVSTINGHSYKNPTQVGIMNTIKKYILPKLELPDNKESINLILNIIRSQEMVEKTFGDARITEVFCDEGLKKAGKDFSLALSAGDVKVTFKSSTDYLLQFADFSAWFVTRVKHITDKHPQEVKPWEKELLKIYSTLPFTNLKPAVYYIDDDQPFDYDKEIEEAEKEE